MSNELAPHPAAGLRPVPGVAPAATAAPIRTATNLSHGWRFRYGDELAHITTADYNDSAWEQVSIPHT